MCQWNCLLTVNSTGNGSIDLQLSVQILTLLAFIAKQSRYIFRCVLSNEFEYEAEGRDDRFHRAILYHGCRCQYSFLVDFQTRV